MTHRDEGAFGTPTLHCCSSARLVRRIALTCLRGFKNAFGDGKGGPSVPVSDLPPTADISLPSRTNGARCEAACCSH